MMSVTSQIHELWHNSQLQLFVTTINDKNQTQIPKLSLTHTDVGNAKMMSGTSLALSFGISVPDTKQIMNLDLHGCGECQDDVRNIIGPWALA